MKKSSLGTSFLGGIIVRSLSAMAQGLFASLLIGTIIKTIGQQMGLPLVVEAGSFAMSMAGPAMAISIAYAMHASPLVIFSMAAVGMAANTMGGAGGPLAVFVISLIATGFGYLVGGRTKIDILITPLVTIGAGIALSYLMAPAIGTAASSVGNLIMWATTQQPFIMGILVSVIVGMALTLPISSAAICAALGLTGLAGGAALAGCCAQMVGFAVMSINENGINGLISQGLGTSMLQMGNIVRNPRIWLPPIIVSAITGPLATCLFHLEMNGPAISSGMGTCGLVGQIGVYTGWMNEIAEGSRTAITTSDWTDLILISAVLPAILTPLVALVFRRMRWINKGDLKID
ncbi:MAG: PTS sugar transporter subunit IIC [Bacteroidales bacterium]|nr:PTS sugar transporter subunit IIC [Bacteroidales bacterium]